MKNGDLEKQPEPLETVTISAYAGLATADPTSTDPTSTDATAIDATATDATASEPAATESAATVQSVIALKRVTKESLWQRLRKQPRETAAVVVLVVTAIIWLDSGDSNSAKNQTSKSLDPMDGFESYLSDFDAEPSSAPLRESADPADTQSPASFGGDLTIPQTQQSEFASKVTANYGDAAFESGNSSSNHRDSATTAAQYPADADGYGSPAYKTNNGSTGFDANNSGSQQNRRVRFAGRIKPTN